MIGLYDHWIDMQGYFLEDSEQWSRHAVQSIVWNAAGETDSCRSSGLLSSSMQDARNWLSSRKI